MTAVLSDVVAYGDPRIPARVWDRVVIDPSGCWLWTGWTSANGYGQFRYAGRGTPAHRGVCLFLLGSVPAELQVDHLCRVRHCVNPAHLEIVTPSVNAQRAQQANRRKTHCPRGHEYDEANTQLLVNKRTGGPHRVCRKCYQDKRRAKREAARA